MKRSSVLGVVLAFVLVLSACGDANASGDAEADEQEVASSGESEASGEQDVPAERAAGTEETGGASVTVRNITLEWRVNGDALEVSVSAPTTGWVAVGFAPTRAMKDANILIGYVADDEVVVTDQFGTTMIQHAQDSELGGSVDVTVLGGSEQDGTTTLQFSIPLDSGDEYDQPLTPGAAVKVILAYGENGADDLTSYHRDRASADITL